jgi:hypothetical protein
MRVSLDKRFAMLWHVKKLAAFARMEPRQTTTRNEPSSSAGYSFQYRFN